jgi:hypothetical protein
VNNRVESIQKSAIGYFKANYNRFSEGGEGENVKDKINDFLK